ncbi:MAG TPA: SH3 domain-containing protein [Oceanobacillus sp.]|nr:SH3 domain-containing protein [Oceanobacillus sp.]
MKRTLSLILLILTLYASPNLVHADACLNAPVPRLHVGMQAVVAENIGPLNLRALPAVSTGVEVQLYSGNRLTVLSGPSCNGHFNWWRVETANGRRGWVAEGTWERYWVVPLRDFDRQIDPMDWACLPRFDTRKCIEW